MAGVSTTIGTIISGHSAGGENAARREQAARHAGNAQWPPALFPAERIGGLASLQPATLRLAADVRYGSKTSGNSSPKLRAGACRSVVIFSALVGSLVRSMRTAIKVAVRDRLHHRYALLSLLAYLRINPLFGYFVMSITFWRALRR